MSVKPSEIVASKRLAAREAVGRFPGGEFARLRIGLAWRRPGRQRPRFAGRCAAGRHAVRSWRFADGAGRAAGRASRSLDARRSAGEVPREGSGGSEARMTGNRHAGQRHREAALAAWRSTEESAA